MSRRYFSTKQVGEQFGVSAAVVTHWIRAELLDAIKLPAGDYRISEAHLERFEAQRQS